MEEKKILMEGKRRTFTMQHFFLLGVSSKILAASLVIQNNEGFLCINITMYLGHFTRNFHENQKINENKKLININNN